MKKTKPNIVKNIFKLAMAMLIVTVFSCGPDTQEFEEGLKPGKDKKTAKLKVIAKGAEIHGSNGIYFGPDDNLYIASFYGGNITAMNKKNGKILKQFGVDDVVFGPDDLVFHPDGESFYFTDILTGFVTQLGLEGNFIQSQYIADGVNPITFLEVEGEEPRLFMALDFQGDGLFELDPDNLSNFRAIIEPSPTNPFPLGFFNAFDFGPDGRLYGPSFLFKQVISVDVGEWGDTPTSDPFGDGTAIVVNGDDDWDYPVAAKFGPDGLLTVLDQNGKVWKVNHETGAKTLFTTLQPGLDNLAFDSDGTLYISNADFGWIVQILPSGQARTISGGGMIGPQGVAVLQGKNKKDKVFVGNVFRMHQINGLTGKEENVYKGYLVGESGKLTMPFSVQADGENLVVSNWFDGLVQVWSPETDEVVENQQYQMVVPIDAVRVNGEIIVSDLVQGLVQASDGSKLDTPVIVASGLATDGINLWAADWATGTVYKIDLDGTQHTPVATGLSNPEGLAFEKEGSLVVVETGAASRLSRIDLEKDPEESVSVVVEGLELSAPALPGPGSVPTWWFDGVAVGPSGDIYISGGGANVLYRVSP